MLSDRSARVCGVGKNLADIEKKMKKKKTESCEENTKAT